MNNYLIIIFIILITLTIYISFLLLGFGLRKKNINAQKIKR